MSRFFCHYFDRIFLLLPSGKACERAAQEKKIVCEDYL